MKFQISNRFDGHFGMVPRALWKMDLPAAAKSVAAYLFCLHDGAVPYVAEIERDVGLGRDARRKAFNALLLAGVIEWHVERSAGVIVGKTLVLHADRVRAPESQADGKNGGETHRAPEIPADGKPVAKSTETRRVIDGKSGDTLKEKKRESAKRARKAVAGAPSRRSPLCSGGGPLVDVSGLTDLQRSAIAEHKSVLVAGELVEPGSPKAEALRLALRRAHDAEKGQTYAAQ